MRRLDVDLRVISQPLQKGDLKIYDMHDIQLEKKIKTYVGITICAQGNKKLKIYKDVTISVQGIKA